MRVTVFGATGRTGRAVVDVARARGFTVVAAARSAGDVPWPDGVEPLATDIEDAPSVARALTGADAAVVAVGVGSSQAATTVYSAGVANVLAAGVPRLSVVSAVPAGPRESLPASQRLVARVLDRFFGASYDDMRRMEAVLTGSDRDWVCLRPPRLLVKPARGGYRLGDGPMGSSIICGDLAAALLDVLDDPAQRRRCRYVAG